MSKAIIGAIASTLDHCRAFGIASSFRETLECTQAEDARAAAAAVDGPSGLAPDTLAQPAVPDVSGLQYMAGAPPAAGPSVNRCCPVSISEIPPYLIRRNLV